MTLLRQFTDYLYLSITSDSKKFTYKLHNFLIMKKIKKLHRPLKLFCEF